MQIFLRLRQVKTAVLNEVGRVGWRYYLRFSLYEKLTLRISGWWMSMGASRVGRGFLASRTCQVIRDKDSRIEFGDRCFVKRNAEVRSTRMSSNGPPAVIMFSDKCTIKEGAVVYSMSGVVSFGRNCALGRNAEVLCHEGAEVKVGSNVRIAAYAFITTGKHRFDDVIIPICEQGIEAESVEIEDDVWIGHGAIVLPGVRVGRGAVIGAGSVVTKNVPPFSVACGVPARVVKKRQANVDGVVDEA